jgi:hypothetical protein
MNAAILIASRELRDKTRLFVTALAMATIPFIASVMPMVRTKGDPSLIAILAGMLAFSMTVGAAAVMGATTIGRDLSDGRLSFYFSKPIPPVAIWIGKAAAALLASFVCYGIIAVPAMLYAGEAWRSTWTFGTDSAVRLTLIGAVVLFFLLHAASTIVRSRSVLIALDFILAAATSAAVVAILRPLAWSSQTLLTGTAIGIGIAIVIVLAIAPAWQLAIGRTDRRRSHAALSKALWIGVAVVLALATAFVGWVVSADPNDLKRNDLEVAQSPGTGWGFISGLAKNRADYHASLLVRPDGSFERVLPMWWGADFSRDGKTLAWVQPLNPLRPREMELYWRDLSRTDSEPEATGIRFGFREFVLSDDGHRVAMTDGINVAVHDLPNKRLLFSGRAFTRDDNIFKFFFVTPDVVRLISKPRHSGKQPVSITEVDIAHRTVTKTGTTEPLERYWPVASPDGSRLLFPREGLVTDGRTGATIARLEPMGFGSLFLHDGTLVMSAARDKAAQVTIRKPDGSVINIPLPGVPYVFVRGELTPGKVVVQGGNAFVRDYPTLAKVFIIDVSTGHIDRVEEHLRGPMVAWNRLDPRPLPIDTGRPLITQDLTKGFVLWDTKTGERKALGFGQ